ncbi:MAG: DNA repair protein RadC [Deinococcales bacterium]|nr:DNA repair protein RadC [Chitinophagaceae bacterium]
MAAIKNWATDDRPREKLMLKGASALSNSELLAILINNGTTNKSAVDLAKELLTACNNNLQRLGDLNYQQMVQLKIKGLGPAKAITIAAALELGIRRDANEKKKDKIISSRDIADFLQAQLQYKNHEVFVTIFLNVAQHIIHHEILSEGGIDAVMIEPRAIIKKALEYNAKSIILCHNHPSGNLKPSRQDLALTEKIKQAASLFDIKVIDHIIVSNEGYYSFADDGMI